MGGSKDPDRTLRVSFELAQKPASPLRERLLIDFTFILSMNVGFLTIRAEYNHLKHSGNVEDVKRKV